MVRCKERVRESSSEQWGSFLDGGNGAVRFVVCEALIPGQHSRSERCFCFRGHAGFAQVRC